MTAVKRAVDSVGGGALFLPLKANRTAWIQLFTVDTELLPTTSPGQHGGVPGSVPHRMTVYRGGGCSLMRDTCAGVLAVVYLLRACKLSTCVALCLKSIRKSFHQTGS